MNEFLSELDKKFNEKIQNNLKALNTIRSNLQHIKVNVFGEELVAIIPPISVEKEMLKDVNNMEPYDFAEKYLPILYGIPAEEVANLPSMVVGELIKNYFEEYKKLMENKSFRNRMGTE